MATVTITLTDNVEDGTVHTSISFVPALRPQDECTPAQHLAVRYLEGLRSDAELDCEKLDAEGDEE